MSSLSFKNLRNFFLLGAALAVSYLFLKTDQIFLYRLIDGLFVGGIFPLVLGCFRLAKYFGSFDLLVYGQKKMVRLFKKHGRPENEAASGDLKTENKADTYSEFLAEKKPVPTYREPLIAGGVYFLASLFLTLAFY